MPYFSSSMFISSWSMSSSWAGVQLRSKSMPSSSSSMLISSWSMSSSWAGVQLRSKSMPRAWSLFWSTMSLSFFNCYLFWTWSLFRYCHNVDRWTGGQMDHGQFNTMINPTLLLVACTSDQMEQHNERTPVASTLVGSWIFPFSEICQQI